MQGTDPGQSMFVDEVTLEQVFLWVLKFLLWVSFHQCSIRTFHLI